MSLFDNFLAKISVLSAYVGVFSSISFFIQNATQLVFHHALALRQKKRWSSARREAKKRDREGGAREGKMCKKEIPKAKAIIHYALFPIPIPYSLTPMHHATCTLHHLWERFALYPQCKRVEGEEHLWLSPDCVCIFAQNSCGAVSVRVSA